MSFTWTEDLVTIDSEDLNEIKTNIDSIITYLEITPFSWSELPVADGGSIQSADAQELRNATDYIDDNKCPSFYTGEDVGYDLTYNSGYLNNQNGTYYSGEKGTEYSGQDSAENSSNDSGHKIGYHITVKLTHDQTDNSNYYVPYVY